MAESRTSAPGPGSESIAGDDRTGGFGSLGSIVLLLALTWAAAIASFPLNDNSFLTHLATGRLILDEGRVPSTDPYTFTAEGEPWTVQSWLASTAYAGVERLAGDAGLRLLVLAVFLLAVTILWRLTRPATSIMVRLVIVATALLIATDLWSARPYMIGVIGLGLVWLTLEGVVRPWLLVPLLWLWVNAHGSWPLAWVLVVAFVAGSVADQRGANQPLVVTNVQRQVSAAVVAGTLLGAVSPLGPKVLWFPLAAVRRGDTFAEIIEWQPPGYQLLGERSFLVLLVVTILSLIRSGSWRLALPAVLFGASAVYAQRNVVMAVMVMVAALASCTPRVGALTSGSRPKWGVVLASGLVLVFLTVAVTTAATPAIPAGALGGYPTHAVAWMSAREIEGRVAGDMRVGNLMEVLEGASAEVFIDDRVDMFPTDVFEDHLRLASAHPGWDAVLDRHDVEVSLWRRTRAIASVLTSDRRWAVVYSDTEWIVASRRLPLSDR